MSADGRVEVIDRFELLDAEFKTASDRLKETKNRSERQALLSEVWQIVREMEQVVDECKPAH